MEENKMNELKEKVEDSLEKATNDGITVGNVDYIFKLVDIHKDLENEKYWKDKKEAMKMQYRENYGRRMRDSRGRFMEGGRYDRDNYGRDNYFRNYRGHDLIDEMFVATSDNAPTCRDCDLPLIGNEDVLYKSVIDGFIVSKNIEVNEVTNVSNCFEYSDHQPVIMNFTLKA